ncbi:hypothetical protein TRFO_21512 [Tritrichomonas foetus]|uniref:Tyrosine specific protein phosphatases domain-containing protein n=1 Tax=Tritrichomonas foetus TaxID=1144522 RepID=A0A1J4KED8_9EUKA|nr:hypothetical protein TRFO_21512 [Tritrichomonas foetus]|eukprot:OHT09555.1 hypothetical protein TRFO_21512 [Tritrichomonas foetus]
MGNRRFGRRPLAVMPVSPSKSIPHRWLSCPNHGHIIHLDSVPNLYFIPMKSPLSDTIATSLRQTSSWTIRSAIAKAKSLVKNQELQLLAVNVSAKHEVVTQVDWESQGALYGRVEIPSDYSSSAVDQFSQLIFEKLENAEKEGKVLVSMVYCGCGLNRVGFIISAFLAKNGGLSLSEALKKCDESSPRLIYRQKPLDVLADIFNTTPQIHGPAPEWVKLGEKVGSIGDIPLPLEKFNAIKKVSKKQASNDEKIDVLSLLADAVNDPSVNDGNFPIFNSTLWNSQSFSLLRSKPHYITFEPRGVRVFIVVLNDSRTFIVDANCLVWELKVKARCQAPAVASAYLVEEKKRAVILTTDLFLLGQVNLTNYSLNDRLAFLAHSFTNKLKMEPQEQQYMLHFVFRPMTKLSNSSKLRKDIESLFVKCDGLSFHEIDGEPMKALFLPIHPTLILQFEYNGNDKAILYARGENSQLDPVGIYIAPSPKYNGFDGRTNRFQFDHDKHEWVPVAVGHNDPPATSEEVKELFSFFSTNISYDSIIKELDKIVVNNID